MRGEADFVSGLQHLRRAYDYWSSFKLDNPESRAARIFGQYCNKMEWIVNDLKTYPLFPDIVRQSIGKEWKADQFTSDAIQEKIALLTPDQRTIIEEIIDTVLKGEKLQIEVKPENVS